MHTNWIFNFWLTQCVVYVEGAVLNGPLRVVSACTPTLGVSDQNGSGLCPLCHGRKNKEEKYTLCQHSNAAEIHVLLCVWCDSVVLTNLCFYITSFHLNQPVLGSDFNWILVVTHSTIVTWNVCSRECTGHWKCWNLLHFHTSNSRSTYHIIDSAHLLLFFYWLLKLKRSQLFRKHTWKRVILLVLGKKSSIKISIKKKLVWK